MDLAKRDFRRILLIKPSSLGDVTHALPVLAGLRRRYPRAHIAWLVSVTCRDLIDGHPDLDEVIPFDRRRYGRLLQCPRIAREFLGFAYGLWRRRFDLVVDLQGLFRSGFLAWATRADVRIGFGTARELAWAFYTHRVAAADPDEHAAVRNYRVAPMLGFGHVPMTIELSVPQAAKERARALLASHGIGAETPFAAMATGARWETKVWPADRMARVADHLYREHGLTVVLVGGADEEGPCEAVASATRAPTANLAGKTTIADVMAIIDRASILISNDSGPMHIAAALDRPVVAVFGPTNPNRTGPYSTRSRVVRRELACSPCYLRKRSACPYDHRCMQELAVEAVLPRVDALLAETRMKASAR
jgi:heptosyltransferase-1